MLSLYWVDEPAWQGNDLHTALRLMCIPRVLVPRLDNYDESCLASAALVERALFENGFNHPELVDFSMKGILVRLRIVVRRGLPPHKTTNLLKARTNTLQPDVVACARVQVMLYQRSKGPDEIQKAHVRQYTTPRGKRPP